ncbi:MAG: antitoxin Xre/MbcA/ParS toxin-binding domain-containing protein [Flavobacteriaceae bacterium]
MTHKEYKQQPESLNVLSEEIRTYVRKFDGISTAGIQPEALNYSNFFENKMLIIQTIRQGLPYKLFNKIKDFTPFTEDDWAEYLNLSKKTLLRHRNDSNYFFKPIHTEKIIELAEVTNFGKEVFNSTEQFYLWLNTPSYALGNLKPAELLKDSYGKELVMNELNQIEQGIFA